MRSKGWTRPSRNNGFELIEIDSIRTDLKSQARLNLDENTIERYINEIKEETQFPPVTLFKDRDSNYILSDGFHRVEAHRSAGMKKIKAFVKYGSAEDALLFSIEANKSHGLPLSFNDRKNVAVHLMKSDTHKNKSDREIARLVGISRTLVSQLRKKTSGKNCQIAERSVERNGKTYKMNVAKIGGQTLEEDELEKSLADDLDISAKDEKQIDDELKEMGSEDIDADFDDEALAEMSDEESLKTFSRAACDKAESLKDTIYQIKSLLEGIGDTAPLPDFVELFELSEELESFFERLRAIKSTDGATL